MFHESLNTPDLVGGLVLRQDADGFAGLLLRDRVARRRAHRRQNGIHTIDRIDPAK